MQGYYNDYHNDRQPTILLFTNYYDIYARNILVSKHYLIYPYICQVVYKWRSVAIGMYCLYIATPPKAWLDTKRDHDDNDQISHSITIDNLNCLVHSSTTSRYIHCVYLIDPKHYLYCFYILSSNHPIVSFGLPI